VRLLLGPDGEIEVQHTPLNCVNTWTNITETSHGNKSLKVVLDSQPIDTHSPYVTNKTTQRDIYNAARQRANCDFHAGEEGKEDSVFDVLLYNEKRQITETSIANIAVEMEPGMWVTPSTECGLLAGIFRRHLLQSGQVREGIVYIDDLTSKVRLILKRNPDISNLV
jgi:4-amino-4-deoxychorismate lyase